VSVVDPVSRKVVSTITGITSSPHGIAVSPSGRVYVTSSNYATPNDAKLSVYDATNKLIATVPFTEDDLPWDVAATDSRVYVTSPWNNTVISVDTTKNNAVTRIAIEGGPPQEVAVTAAGKVYVAKADGTVAIITNNVVSKTITVGGNPVGLLNGPGGSILVIGPDGSTSMTRIDPATDAVTTVLLAQQPTGLPDGAFSPDFTAIYTPVYFTNELWVRPASTLSSPSSA
jgi:streptogramin lyase